MEIIVYLVDTNIFLEILLSQEKSQKCKEILKSNIENICISDFSLHSIGVILFRYKKENIFRLFLHDFVCKTKIVTLSKKSYINLSTISKEYGLDFDDAYQFEIAHENGFELVTMDKDFDKVKNIIKIKNI